ncbi:MAG TPA: FtsX-like permease family protein [Sedimentisphaerales bacterium]|nr:FtsX-like permease family protein [Sedimentisphaerales bacterium]
MLKYIIWLRYLSKKKIVLLSIAAVAFSCALLIVVSSLFTGFINAFEASASDTLGDVVIAASDGMKIEKYDHLIESLKDIESVEAATAVITTQGLLRLASGNVRAVEIWGIDIQTRAQVVALKQSLLKQKDSLNPLTFNPSNNEDILGGFIGIAITEDPDPITDEYDVQAVLKENIDKKVALTTGVLIEDDAVQGESRFKRRNIAFTITDIFFTGTYEIDKNFVFLPIDKLQEKLYPDIDLPIADQVHIKLKADSDIELSMAQIAGLWQNFAKSELGWSDYRSSLISIKTSKQMQEPLVAEFRKQMQVLLAIFSVVSFSVVVLIFCIFYMIVETKRKDIGIIRSCGASTSTIMGIFLGFGGCVGFIGAGFGVLLGYLITKNVNIVEHWVSSALGLKLWKSSVYLFTKIPNEMDWDAVMPIVISATVAACLGVLLPAIVAAKVRPVKILRYE